MKITKYLMLFSIVIVLAMLGLIVPAEANTYPSNGTIYWKGQEWDNLWDNTGNNTWVDDQDRLHLTVKNYGDMWSETTVSTKNKYLYGTFTWSLDSPVYTFDKNSVVGLFTYADNDHELDIEISRWQEDINSQLWYTVQPGLIKGNKYSYSIPSSTNGTNTKYRIKWKPNYVRFTAWKADGKVIASQTYTNISRIPAVPQYAVMNLWLLDSPSDGQNIELIISDFTYTNTTLDIQIARNKRNSGLAFLYSPYLLSNGTWIE